MATRDNPDVVNCTTEKWVVYSWDGNHRTWHSWYSTHSEEEARDRAKELRSKTVRIVRVRTTIETVEILDPYAPSVRARS